MIRSTHQPHCVRLISKIPLFLVAAFFWGTCSSFASFDREGKMERPNVSCSLADIAFISHDSNASLRSYSFSGPCTVSYDDYYATNEDPNFSYSVNGTWNIGSKTATEVFTTRYNTITATYSCEFDPWLDPAASCTRQSITASHNDPYGEVMSYIYEQVNTPPASRSGIGTQRTALVEQAMARSIQIIDPTPHKYYNNPSMVTITVTMEKVVEAPPPRQVVIEVEAVGQPIAFSESKNFITAPVQLLTYFPMENRHLSGASWNVTAHLAVTDPFKTPAVTFSVLHDKRIRIIAPQAGQKIAGDVLVKVDLEGYPGATASSGPEIDLDWTWSPFSKPGDWPPIPKQMDIRPKMQGTDLVIPRAAFTENGIWNLTATIQVTENQSISDQVSFSFQELTSLAGQVEMSPMPPISKKVQPNLSLPADKQHIKPMENKTGPAPLDTFTAPPTAHQKTNLKQLQPSVSAMGAPKAAPTIIRPQEREKIDKPGLVPISTRVDTAETTLLWEIEYQAFGAASFVRQPGPRSGAMTTSGATLKTTRLTFSAPGHYRFRVKEDNDKALWSGWRTIVVGSPPPLVPASKAMQLQTKPTLSTDAIKTTPQQQETSAPEIEKTQQRPISKQVKPATVNPQPRHMVVPNQ
jgi:hypothetical protein